MIQEFLLATIKKNRLKTEILFFVKEIYIYILTTTCAEIVVSFGTFLSLKH